MAERFDDDTLINALTNRPISGKNHNPSLSEGKGPVFICIHCDVHLNTPVLAIQHFFSKTHFSRVQQQVSFFLSYTYSLCTYFYIISEAGYVI